MRSASLPTRTICAALLALLFALRMLSPAGFMPAFDHGAVTIVTCPDYDSPPSPMSMSGHHHHDPKKAHQACPYAAGAAAATASGLATLAALFLFAAAPLVGRPFGLLDPLLRERPPSRGPPLPT
jgi:hypothetical protein